MSKQVMHCCGEQLKYDPQTEHFICKKCGNITEEVQAETFEPNFMIQEVEEDDAI